MDCVKNDSAAQIHFSLLILKYKYLLCLFRWRKKTKTIVSFFFLSSWLYMVLTGVSPSFFSEFPHFRLTPFSFSYTIVASYISAPAVATILGERREKSCCVLLEIARNTFTYLFLNVTTDWQRHFVKVSWWCVYHAPMNCSRLRVILG